MAEIGLEGVGKRFVGQQALDDLTLTIADGEFFVMLGPTGAGKTTTLRLIAGLETPDAGTVSIGGRDVAEDLRAQFRQTLGRAVLKCRPRQVWIARDLRGGGADLAHRE